MTPASDKPTRFKLPARIRNRKTTSDRLETRLALTERIAGLRGIETVECSGDTVPCQVDVYIRHGSADRAKIRRKQPPPLLCSLNCNSALIGGLDCWARHQVVSSGWGKLISDQVLVFLPRDCDELEIFWGVLKLAYDSLLPSSASAPRTDRVTIWDLPRYSRTTLQ